ncbi:hypothetical protein [Wolbachia endosymbiont of Tetranychus urticae]|uniref:hypothetical protein n=1 Tax=Wolbachia endosymbiont of Tetranychus urticae TaxID=169184 RepID=UPI00397D92B4
MTNIQKELIELLIEDKFPEFIERAQSFIDQMPKSKGASSAPGKEEFVTGQYLGMFASLKDTEIYDNLNVNKISFKLDDRKNLNVVLSHGKESKQQKIFVFTQNKETEINEVLNTYKQKYNGNVCVVNVHDQQIRLDGSPLNNNYQVPSSFIDISRTEGGSANKKLEKYISDIQGLNINNDSRAEPVNRLFNYSSDLYKKIRDLLSEKLRELFNVEALQHGFITGELMNFRYRSNLKTNLELISG